MKNLIEKTWIMKPIVAIMILSFINLSFTFAENKVVLKAGTFIPLEVISEITTANMTVGNLLISR